MASILGIFKGVSWFEWLLLGALSSLLGVVFYFDMKNTNLTRDNVTLSSVNERVRVTLEQELKSSQITDEVVNLHIQVRDDITKKAIEIQEDILTEYFDEKIKESSVRGNPWELSDEKPVLPVSDNPKPEESKAGPQVRDASPTRSDIAILARGMYQLYCNADRGGDACPTEGTTARSTH